MNKGKTKIEAIYGLIENLGGNSAEFEINEDLALFYLDMARAAVIKQGLIEDAGNIAPELISKFDLRVKEDCGKMYANIPAAIMDLQSDSGFVYVSSADQELTLLRGVGYVNMQKKGRFLPSKYAYRQGLRIHFKGVGENKKVEIGVILFDTRVLDNEDLYPLPGSYWVRTLDLAMKLAQGKLESLHDMVDDGKVINNNAQ